MAKSVCKLEDLNSEDYNRLIALANGGHNDHLKILIDALFADLSPNERINILADVLIASQAQTKAFRDEIENIKKELFKIKLFGGILPHEARVEDSVKSATYQDWRINLKNNFFNKEDIEFCMITKHIHDNSLDSNNPLFVRAMHAIPITFARAYNTKFLNDESVKPIKANSVSNGLFMLKILEDAYGECRLCILPNPLNEGIYTWYILDKSLIKELESYNINIESEGTLIFCKKPSSYPYRKSLYSQAINAVHTAKKKKWIDDSHALANSSSFYDPSLLDIHERDSDCSDDSDINDSD